MKHITDNKEQFTSGAVRGVQDKTTPRFDLIDGVFYLHVSLEPDIRQNFVFNINTICKQAESYSQTLEMHAGDCDVLIQLASDITTLMAEQSGSRYRAWERLAILLAQGANKYSARNWEKGMPIKRTFASLCRHLFKYQHELETGERIDDEDHGAAVLFNIMAILYTWRNYGNQFDVET